MSAWLAGLIVVGAVVYSQGQTPAEWAKTIDVAGRQRMLSQRMAKEFLLVAKGYNVSQNTAAMVGSIALFDTTLHQLIDGNNKTGIIAAPSARVADSFQVVLGLWVPYKLLLESSVHTVRAEDGSVDAAALAKVSGGSGPLLTTSNAAVAILVDASSASVGKDGVVVDISGRQRMLIQKMCKEALLVGHGISVSANVQNLRSTIGLFADSHSGIVLGAAWAGVPALEKMCTLHKMREVTFQWENFKPILAPILASNTLEEARDTASTATQQIASESVPLYSAMAASVVLFMNDPGTCTPLVGMKSSEWHYLLNTVGKQRYLGQEATVFYMLIANEVDVLNSKLSLTVNMAATWGYLRSLIEGSIANNIPAPPTPKITAQLFKAYARWVTLQGALQEALNTNRRDPVFVRQIAHFSEDLLTEMNVAVDLYVQSCQANDPSVNAHLVNVAGRQRMLFQKMTKEANLVAYGSEPEHNWALLNYSRNLFITTHWTLLLGNASQGINRTSQVCVAQEMKTVWDIFLELDHITLKVANGAKDSISDLIVLNERAFASMNTAVGFYASGTSSCEVLNVSFTEWKGALRELANLRTLSQKASYLFLLGTYAFSSYRDELVSTVAEMDLSLKRLTFGAGDMEVPPPPNQEILDLWWAFQTEMWLPYRQELEVGSEEAMENATSYVLEEAQRAMGLYIQEADDANMEVPTVRINVLTQQTMLAHMILSEALRSRFKTTIDEGALLEKLALFESSHSNLLNGGGGLPAIIVQRPDLEQSWNGITAAWNEFKPLVLAFAPQDQAPVVSEDLYKLVAAQEALVAALDGSVEVFGILDPFVPYVPLKTEFDWTVIAYCVLGFFLLCLVGCTAGYEYKYPGKLMG